MREFLVHDFLVFVHDQSASSFGFRVFRCVAAPAFYFSHFFLFSLQFGLSRGSCHTYHTQSSLFSRVHSFGFEHSWPSLARVDHRSGVYLIQSKWNNSIQKEKEREPGIHADRMRTLRAYTISIGRRKTD